MKRVFDILGALLLLVPATPIIAVSLLLVRLRTGGRGLFRQTREGRSGQPFAMLKVRTMYANAESTLVDTLADDSLRAQWENYRRLDDDPRVIPGIGRWLRRTSLDELPQLWNVLRGDMSLVGPRPLELEVAQRMPADAMQLRRSVRPGLTGLWQVSGRSDHDLETLCSIDVEYVRRRSAAMDLRILLRTPAAVLSGRGSY